MSWPCGFSCSLCDEESNQKKGGLQSSVGVEKGDAGQSLGPKTP